VTEFQDEAGQINCKPVKNCSALQYQFQAPNACSDRGCTLLDACAPFEFESIPATTTTARICKNHTSCACEFFASKAPTSTTDRECTRATICADDQYVKESLEAITDRQCADIYQCDVDFEYETKEPTSGEFGCPETEPPPTLRPCTGDPLVFDLLFVLDSSSSLGLDNWNIILNFTTILVQQLNTAADVVR
jgi:hypothetical protein